MTIHQLLLRKRVAPLAASAAPVAQTAVGAGSSTLSGTSPVTATGGTGSYTYSTTWLSGGANITLSNTTTSAPGYSSTAAPTTTRSGTLRTTVTSGGVTVNADRTVTLSWEN